MRTVALLLLSLVACGGSPKTGALGNVAGAGGPPGPAPTITWSGGVPMDGGSFESTGLPAVADDGSRVLYAWQRGDGGRGFPNLRLVVADRADKALETRIVLDADAVEAKADALDVAVDNRYLADSNAAHRWRPMTAGEVTPVGGEAEDPDSGAMYPSAWSSKAGDIAVRFDDDAHLVIEQAGKVVVDRVMKDWLVLDRPMYAGAAADEICSNPIFLSSLAVDGARRIALVGVDYHGTDTCWEPSGEYHVVAW